MTTKRKAPPPPEERLQGSGSFGGSRDREMERLEKEAERTGNRSALIAYKSKMKDK